MGAKTYNWKEISEATDVEGEEQLLCNTFINSKNQELAQFQDVEEKDQHILKIKWLDEQQQKK